MWNTPISTNSKSFSWFTKKLHPRDTNCYIFLLLLGEPRHRRLYAAAANRSVAWPYRVLQVYIAHAPVSMMVLLKARTAAAVALALSCSAAWLGDRAASFVLVGRGPATTAAAATTSPTARARAQQGRAATALRPSVRARLAAASVRTMASSNAAGTPVAPLPGNCLVIGGNRGLGLEIVRHLKERQSNVLATTRKTNQDLEAIGAKVIEGIDVSDSDSGTKLVEAVREQLGDGETLDYVICNAGILTPDTLEDPKYDAAVKMYEVCVLGPLRALQSLTVSGLLREGSKIGMVTSEGGSVGLRTEIEGGSNYGHHMSKCAQNMMGKIFALDVKPRGIAIVCLHPGFMKTSMTEIYADKYDELGAIGPEQSAPGIVKAVEDLTLETTGRFIAPQGSESLGLGVYALDNPSEYGPFCELPW